MNRHVILGVAGWLTVAAAATGAGIAAVSVLEDGITGSKVRPLDDDAVRRALSSGPATTPSPTPVTTAPAGGEPRVLGTGGGTVTARCDGGQATLVAWTPAQGYRADEVDRGPAATPSLSFTSASREYHVTVHCAGGIPAVRSASDDRHGGGGEDDDGGHGRGRGRGGRG